MKSCEVCGKAFTPSPRPDVVGRACSPRCNGHLSAAKRFGTYVSRSLEPQSCRWCGDSFVPKRNGQRYCGGSCSAKWRAAGRSFRGADNPRYNGGLCIHKGRAMVCCRDGSTLWYSRALMAAHLGRLLRSDEIVHHINGDGSDDRVENLMVVTRSEHMLIHRDEVCPPEGASDRIRKAWETRRARYGPTGLKAAA